MEQKESRYRYEMISAMFGMVSVFVVLMSLTHFSPVFTGFRCITVGYDEVILEAADP